ncbi:unnamed protein product [Clonostachys rosea]|uniref:Altered inheritance of mitochondria protein 24, mitochondrial n=1 Tax=Bionectria ochroleuca TaxID=29856 RepID=A0ABY6V0K8_BIOOC|nr:unnamed protein product [Clonostachys rosea]
MSHSEKAILPSGKTQPPPYKDSGLPERAGRFEGGSYTINHCHTSSTLEISLQENGRFISRVEALIHMSKGINLEPEEKFSVRPKDNRDVWMRYMTFLGPGSVTLSPDLLGDILALSINSVMDQGQWSVRTETILAATDGVYGTLVKKEFDLGTFRNSQDFNHYTLYGKGIMWLATYGVVNQVKLGADQNQIVRTNNLVAWSDCLLSPVKLGGKRPSFVEVQGPGTIYIQTRTIEDWKSLVSWAAPK